MRIIKDYLERELEAGNNFVVFEAEGLPDSVLGMYSFGSSFDAERFCSANAWEQDKEDGSYRETEYSYHAIENLLAEYKATSGLSSIPTTSPEKINGLIQAQGFDVPGDDELSRLYIQLNYGRIVSLQRKASFFPEQVMDAYHIVEHHHQYVGGLIYELGHSAKVRLSFGNIQDAMAAFQKLASTLPHNDHRSMTELMIVGSFIGEPLRLDMEGFPVYDSGLVLWNARQVGDSIKVGSVCNTEQEITFYQKFFARLDAESVRLIPLDDRLQEITTFKHMQSYHGLGFRCLISDELIAMAKLGGRQQMGQKNQSPSPENTPGDVKGKKQGRKL